MGRRVWWEVSIVSNAGAEQADIALGAAGLWLIHEANITRTSGSNGTGLTGTIYREGAASTASKVARYWATTLGGSYCHMRAPATGAGQAGQPCILYTSDGTIRQRLDLSGSSGDTYTLSGIAEYLGPVTTVTATEV